MYHMDPSLLYYSKKAYKIAMIFLIIGGLNWLSVGIFGINLVQTLFGKGLVTRSIYILVGVAAVSILFDRDTYLPFLGETVLPCSMFPERTPSGATTEVRVKVPARSKILYWAAEPSTEHLKELKTWNQAYLQYENAGIVKSDDSGEAVLKVRKPQAYTVPFRGRLEPHIHFRICGENGMLGRIKTVFLDDLRVEGFMDLH
jgi:uncharacterized protein